MLPKAMVMMEDFKKISVELEVVKLSVLTKYVALYGAKELARPS